MQDACQKVLHPGPGGGPGPCYGVNRAADRTFDDR